MTWTKKHDEFCLKQKLRPSTKLLLCWILRRANQYQVTEIEVDLRIFNSWVAKKRGTPYDPKTIKEAMNQRYECSDGLILISKTYSPWVKKLIVRPLSLVTQKKPQKTGIIPQVNGSNCIKKYKPNGRKTEYFRLDYRVKNRVRSIHIPGGNVHANLAQYRVKELQAMINRSAELGEIIAAVQDYRNGKAIDI